MAWPEDETSRKSWVASVMAQRLAHAGRLSISHPISLFGGLELVAREAFDALSGRLTAAMKKWTPVADVMQMLVDLQSPDLHLPGGPSISKAIELCADDRDGRSEAQIRRLWSQYRDVAHLLAAGALLAREVPESDGSIFSATWYAPDSVLGISAGFETFGLNFRPQGQRESALPPQSVWRLPSHCIPEKSWLQRRALSDRQREVLRTYQARKAYIRKN